MSHAAGGMADSARTTAESVTDVRAAAASLADRAAQLRQLLGAL